MKKITIGIVAHVDAGKTTLSESLLYLGGSIKKIGRVDNGDAFLDTYRLERERGITIFSKQANIKVDDVEITLLDTPGHVDFSAEMERTLQVLDYAILVISGSDGIQGHTRTLWNLLEQYHIPTFIFVNKMDHVSANAEKVLLELRNRFSSNVVDFCQEQEMVNDNVAACDDELMERYFEGEGISVNDIKSLVATRKMFPCFFGAALKLEGVEELLRGICKYSLDKCYTKEFGARVYKISRDSQNNRITHMKITGGSLKVKDIVGEEKVNQIRIYSGEKYETVNEAMPGTICAVTGLSQTKAGAGLGFERETDNPVLEPVLNYRIILPDECNVNEMLIKLRQLEEEEPELQIVWNEELKEIHAKLMGEIQIEILKSLILDRFGVEVSFGTGNIVYKETITDIVEGVGHFEPLRHYAEVHLLMEPLPRGSGMEFESICSEDKLDLNWQRLILTHLQEKEHKGVLIGAGITDIKITLVAGKAHLKHTEGGDFRQATYRAVRQGLRMSESVILEPYYEYVLEVQSEMIGRAIADIDRMYGTFEAPLIDGEMAMITGICPVSTMRDYHKEVISYTRGMGKLSCTFVGYDECHNSEEVMQEINYNVDADIENQAGSVFCAKGSGFYVDWDKVYDYMHLELYTAEKTLHEDYDIEKEYDVAMEKKKYASSAREERELEEIFARTYSGIKDSRNLFHTNMSNNQLRDKKTIEKRKVVSKPQKEYVYRPKKRPDEYLIVDGYNIVFAWKELKELAKENIDGARDKLIDILSNYQGAKMCHIIVVFDAYKVKGYNGEVKDYNNIKVVFSKENQTADVCIEQMAHKMGRKYDVTVATSDGMEQITVLSQGCKLMSASELKNEIDYYNKLIAERIESQKKDKNTIFANIDEEVQRFIDSL